jgi:GLPGLI family protein
VIFLSSHDRFLLEKESINRVLYKTSTYKTDEILSPEIKSKRKIIFDAYDSFEYELIYNDTASIFKFIDKMTKDEESIEYKIAKNVAGGLCYKNLKSKEKITQIDNFYEVYNVVKPYDEYKW